MDLILGRMQENQEGEMKKYENGCLTIVPEGDCLFSTTGAIDERTGQALYRELIISSYNVCNNPSVSGEKSMNVIFRLRVDEKIAIILLKQISDILIKLKFGE